MTDTSGTRDAIILSEFILIFYGFISTIFILAIFYFIFIGKAIKLHFEKTKRIKLVVFLLPFIFYSGLFTVIFLMEMRLFIESILLFVVNILFFGFFYFMYFRPNIRSNDFRIQYTVAIWSIVTAVSLSMIFLMFQFRYSVKIEGEFRVSYDMLLQSASVMVSALGIVFTYVMRTEQTQRNTQQQLYQTLELQSIELFRFECDHPDLVQALWFDDESDQISEENINVKNYVVRQYACQMLNLFEMAIRFRFQGILPPDVFGSWMIWIWELCESNAFQKMWLDAADLPTNYVIDLREVISTGVSISLDNSLDSSVKRERFFLRVAQHLDCPEVSIWLNKESQMQQNLMKSVN